MPLLLFTPVLFMCIFYWMVGLNPTAEHFLVAVLITVLINQCAVAMGEGVKMKLWCPQKLGNFFLFFFFFLVARILNELPSSTKAVSTPPPPQASC